MAIGNLSDVKLAASGDQSALLRVLTSYEQAFQALSNQSGISLSAVDPAQSTAIPTQAPQWTVEGEDGHFHVTITPLSQDVSQQAGARSVAAPIVVGTGFSIANARIGRKLPITNATATPNTQIPAIIFHVQSSLNTQFNAAGDVVDYGPSDQLEYFITDHPDEIRFWRIRCRRPASDFSDWSPLVGPSGWLGVESGQLRSTSAVPNMAVNTSNNTVVDSSDNGTNANINIHGPAGPGTSWIHYDGQLNQTIVNAGVIIGEPYSTIFLTMYDPVNGYQAFDPTTQYPSTLFDELFWAGRVETVAHGGTGGETGGGGSFGGGGGGGSTGRPIDVGP